MDEADTRDRIVEHVDAVKRRDMEAILADFSEEKRGSVPEMLEMLPRLIATTSWTVNFHDSPSDAVAAIQYSGTETVTVHTRWQERDGRPVIVEFWGDPWR